MWILKQLLLNVIIIRTCLANCLQNRFGNLPSNAVQLKQFWLIVVGCCQPFHCGLHGGLHKTIKPDVKHFDLVEPLAHACLHNGQHPIIFQADCVNPIHEWEQMAKDGAHAQLLFKVWITNGKFCVGRQHGLNATEKIEHLVIEMAEIFWANYLSWTYFTGFETICKTLCFLALLFVDSSAVKTDHFGHS